MKSISNATKGFAVTACIVTMCMLYFLFHSVQMENYSRVPYLAVGFGALMFGSGLFWGMKDSIRKYRYDTGFVYHLITFITVNGIGIPMMVGMLGYHPGIRTVVVYQIGCWGFGLLVHYWISRRTIKGMEAEEVFS